VARVRDSTAAVGTGSQCKRGGLHGWALKDPA
jgi:hypothetical protein